MPNTVIKIKTLMCPTGLNNPNADCRFHRAIDNLPEDNMCPSCKKELQLANRPDDQMTITVRDEADFDHPDLIEHDGGFKLRQQADIEDKSTLANFLRNLNKDRFIEHMSQGLPINTLKPLTEKDNHGWVAPVRRELDQTEREKWKAKIRADIIKFKAIEHK